MTQLLQYRFGASVAENDGAGRELQGHAFGNLLLAALTGITGSFDEALLGRAAGPGDAGARYAFHTGECEPCG